MSEIIEINGHAVRFKYILVVGPVVNGTFKVSIALGFELPVNGTQADRDALVRAWVEWMSHGN